VTDTCSDLCGCNDDTPERVIQRAAKLLHIDPVDAQDLLRVLRSYDWELTRRVPEPTSP
jgi:hypothetical protein